MAQERLSAACRDDDDLLVELVYHGKPAVKKNSQQIIPARKPGDRPLLVPSSDYRKAERAAVREIAAGGPYPGAPWGSTKEGLHVRALFFLGERQNPDLDGLISGCADILEKAGILANDYHVQSWDGSRRFRDRDNPRTAVLVRRFRP